MTDLHNKTHIWRKKIFINNSTFSDCLHFKDEVLHAHLNLLENTLLCQLTRWYDKVLPNWALIFPMLGFSPCLKLFLAPNSQAPMVLALLWHRSLVWVYVGNKPVEPLHFPFFLQWCLSFFPTIHHYRWDWMIRFLMSESLFPGGWQLQPHKSSKRGFLWLTSEEWFDMSIEHAVILPPIFPLHCPTFS